MQPCDWCPVLEPTPAFHIEVAGMKNIVLWRELQTVDGASFSAVAVANLKVGSETCQIQLCRAPLMSDTKPMAVPAHRLECSEHSRRLQLHYLRCIDVMLSCFYRTCITQGAGAVYLCIWTLSVLSQGCQRLEDQMTLAAFR